MSQPHINSLLDVLSSSQVEDLIDEHKLRVEKGVKFLYTIDNHDLRMYCFPGNIDGSGFAKNENGETNYSLETDYITAYEDFFKNIDFTSPVFFLDEYFSELSDLHSIILDGIRKRNLFNYAPSFNSYYENNNTDANFKKDFTLFISLVSGALNNGAMRYNSIVKNQFFIRGEYDFLEIDRTDSLRDVFTTSYVDGYDLANNIHSKYFLKYTRNTRESKRKDCQAIARLICINKKLLEDSNPKFLFLFLSTTPLSRELFHDKDFHRVLPKQDGDSSGKPFNFHRTAAQLFLKRLIKDLDDHDQLERLQKAKTFINYRERYKQEIDYFEKNAKPHEELPADENYFDQESKNRFLIYKQYKELEQSEVSSFQALIENYVTLNFTREDQFREIEGLYDQLTKSSNNLGSLKRLFRDLKSNYDKISQEDNILNIESVENAFNIQYVFSAIFKKSMSLIHNGEKLVISRGNDTISGTGQHLPVVFKNIGQSSETLDNLADFYLDQFAFINESISDANHVVEIRLREITASVYNINSSSMEELLVFCLYLLILPEVKVFSKKSNNQHVQDFLNEIFKREELSKNDDLHSDYLYVLVWVLRRNKEYVKALSHTQTGIDLFPDDARFYHSRFLIHASEDGDNKSGNEKYNEKRLNSYLDDINLASHLYKGILSKKSDSIRINIEATLLNSKLYSELLIASGKTLSYEEKVEILASLRENELQKLKKLIGADYNKFPEFLHTESVLESMESDLESDPLKRLEKLRCASIAINNAIRQAGKLNSFKLGQYFSLKEIIEEKKAISINVSS
jgi:hypothetical protein